MNNEQISHLIATMVNGWQQVDGIVYLDPASNMYAYRANYPESAPHAIDLAAVNNIAIAPHQGQWKAAKVISSSNSGNTIMIEVDPNSIAVDSSFPKAICLSLLRSVGVEV